MAVFAYLLHSSISRVWLVGQVALGTFILLLARLIMYTLVWKRTYPGLSERNLIIDANEMPLDIDNIPPRQDAINPNVHYERICAPTAGHIDQWLEELKRKIRSEYFDGIIISQGAASIPGLVTEISKLYNLGVTGIILETKSASLYSRFKALPHPNWVAIEEPGITNNDAVVKRLFDIVGSAILIVLLSPIFIVTTIAVAINSTGPVLYIADRVGQNQKLFRFPKFRSMYENADQKRLEILGRPDEEMVERYRNDPRITKVGRFIRKYSIDELPQLFCVLNGSMSLVGPRPILPEEYEQLRSNDEYRFITKPGLTGMWQISGRKTVNWPERMALDIYYLENWSIGLDLFIILKTIRVVLSGEGAM
jgi:exopolysaccharide biosynthesis polyprenyl glycosylphosphotransferase